MWQKLNRLYPPQLELLSLVLLFFAFYMAVTAYPTLPDTIPTHFGAGGKPDDWGGKGGIFLSPGVGLGVFLLMTGITVAFALVKDPRSLINLPVDKKAVITVERAEAVRRLMSRSLFVLKAVILGMCLYLTNATIRLAEGKSDTLGVEFWFFISGIFVVVVYMLVNALRLLASPGKPKRG